MTGVTVADSEMAGAVALVGAALLALTWANVWPASYASFWSALFVVGSGQATVSLSLRDWVNSGLMTIFFLRSGWRRDTWGAGGRE